MAPGSEETGPIEARLIRPIDLIDLTCTVHGARLERTSAGPVLAVDGDDAFLVLTWPYQHLAEQAWPDYKGSTEPAKVGARSDARAADGSRLAYDLPAGLRVPYSLAGILTVLPQLALRLPDPSGVRNPFQLKPRPTRRVSRAPGPDETAIEAPYRLIVAPDGQGVFVHAVGPITAPPDDKVPDDDVPDHDAPDLEVPDDAVVLDRVELWHSDLAVRSADDPSTVITDPDHADRVVRAVWARDLTAGTPPDNLLHSLSPDDRRALVRQTSRGVGRTVPLPLQVRTLALSSQGAWIDWQGAWDTKPYLATTEPGSQPDALESYRHVAAMGRDSYVRVTRPGFLFSLGNRSSYVTITERRVEGDATPVAYLRQYHRIEVREPRRRYDDRRFPFREVTISPLVTPNLDPPTNVEAPTKPGERPAIPAPFFPTQGGEPFCWDLTAVDHTGAVHHFHAPLLFVPDSAVAPSVSDQTIHTKVNDEYHKNNVVAGNGQAVAMAASSIPGDTTVELASMTLDGAIDSDRSSSQPFVTTITAVVPAMRHLAPQAPVQEMTYAPAYLQGGFGTGNRGQVFLQLKQPTVADFATGSDRAGGFLSPNLSVAALSRTLGAVGDLGDDPATGLGAGRFSAKDFLGAALPKLFGLFSLTDLLPIDAALDAAPHFVTETLDTLSSIRTEGDRLAAAITATRTRLDDEITRAAHGGAAAALHQARQALEADAQARLDRLATLAGALTGVLTGSADEAALRAAVTAVQADLTTLKQIVDQPALPAAVRAALDVPSQALGALLGTLDVASAIKTLLAGGILPGPGATAGYTWTTRLRSWPDAASPVFDAADSELTLAVSVRTAAQGAPVVDVSAELRRFALQLLPGAQLMRLRFDRLGFRAGSARKPEVDVVFGGMEFLGPLSFIDTLRRMIPFDGFADPPHVDVSSTGVTAGFDLALPNVSVGVFSLENIALRADARIPFLGDAVTVGFAFCAKDSPFRMTVLCVGGGGWVALRASAMGLVELEMGLEAAASLSIDLGVASGSVSVAVGVYLRLEGTAGSLTAYVRIRGEVNVLGLVSACITLELSLTYEFSTGELVGRATLIVDVEVLFFSASVEITCERRLAGSRADPTMADLMPPDTTGPGQWADYCSAFTTKGA